MSNQNPQITLDSVLNEIDIAFGKTKRLVEDVVKSVYKTAIDNQNELIQVKKQLETANKTVDELEAKLKNKK